MRKISTVNPKTPEQENAGFRSALSDERVRVDARIGDLLDGLVVGPELLGKAIRYVMLGGGKRLRPILCLWTHDALAGRSRDACLDAAVALECLHAYTLVHDDLPCMDDDDMRRGRPSCHKQFDEATAVLVGDALQALCFEIVATIPDRYGLDPARTLAVARCIAEAAGSKGLVTGQILDLDPESVEATIAGVEKVHRHKTGALISASMLVGALLASDNTVVHKRVREAGMAAGLAFQIIDDILDIETDQETLGKTPGKDAQAGKRTYPAVAGVAASRDRSRELIEEAKDALNVGDSQLGRLFDFLVERSR